MTSKLTFLRAGIQETGFTRIMSFRRQVFINPDDLSKIPQSFLINHDDTQYRIFASTDKLNYFLCKQEGHVAKDCSNPPQPTATNQAKTTEPENKQIQDRTHEYTNTANNINTPPNISNITEIETTSNYRKTLLETDFNRLPNYKRPLSVPTDSYSEDGNEYLFLPPTPDQPEDHPTGNIKESTPITIAKRPKRSQSLTRFIEKLDEMLKPIKLTLDDTKSNFILLLPIQESLRKHVQYRQPDRHYQKLHSRY